jgi:hypothetical protein
MIKKLLGLSLVAVFLSGCVAYTPVKFAADKVCEATDKQQAVMAESFDKATFPHEVRVKCYVQTDKPKVTFSE